MKESLRLVASRYVLLWLPFFSYIMYDLWQVGTTFADLNLIDHTAGLFNE